MYGIIYHYALNEVIIREISILSNKRENNPQVRSQSGTLLTKGKEISKAEWYISISSNSIDI